MLLSEVLKPKWHKFLGSCWTPEMSLFEVAVHSYDPEQL